MLWHERCWKVIRERTLVVSLWDPSGMCREACCSARLLIEICGISENRLSCQCWHHNSPASHPLKTGRERDRCSLPRSRVRTSQHAQDILNIVTSRYLKFKTERSHRLLPVFKGITMVRFVYANMSALFCCIFRIHATWHQDRRYAFIREL